jgi:hypothetical protein
MMNSKAGVILTVVEGPMKGKAVGSEKREE